MGLFSNDKNTEEQELKNFWNLFLENWNSWYAAPYPHYGIVNEPAIAPFMKTADAIMASNVFPPKPSAFKRLGTLAILTQHFPLIHLEKNGGTSFTQNEDCEWMPRLGLTATQIFASHISVVLPSGIKKLSWFTMPSPHFQLEFLSVLRSYRLAAHHTTDDLDLDILCERALNASLILESSYYLHEIKISGFQERTSILGEIEGCLQNLDPVHEMDINFQGLAAEEIANDWGR